MSEYRNNVVGHINLDDKKLDVYSSLDEPIFKASDVADMIDYRDGNIRKMLKMCEEDEKLQLLMLVRPDQKRMIAVDFVTETGLYNILAQSRNPIARKWRRVINNKIIDFRKSRNMDIIEQFDEWDHELDDIYIDPETGIMMQSVTVEGGDVIQVPYEPEDDM